MSERWGVETVRKALRSKSLARASGRKAPSGPLILALLLLAACAARSSRPPGLEVGVASWYGPGFHGRPTTSGEIYDQYDLTAAHPTWPLGTRVLVTNLDNGRVVEVRINDRGPFVRGRSIDLSYAAARALGMVDQGTSRVRIAPLTAPGQALGMVVYAVQVGAFADQATARELKDRLIGMPELRAGLWQRRLGNVYVVAVELGTQRYFRVRVGPYVARGQAESGAALLARAGFDAMVIEEVMPRLQTASRRPKAEA